MRSASVARKLTPETKMKACMYPGQALNASWEAMGEAVESTMYASSS